MRAVVCVGPDEVDVADVPDPRLIDTTDAIVRVELTGVCGTDVHLLHAGELPPGTVPGHEFVGTVVETGAAVGRLAVGQRVMSSDFTACGRCRRCERGDHWHCPHRRFFGTATVFGPELTGAQAQFVRVPFADTTLAPLPDGVDPESALLIGDNLATGWSAVERAGVQPGDVVAVVGGGPVGQLTALCAQICGAAVVVVSDPVAARRELAARQGSVAVPPDRLSPTLRELTGGDGADAVFECVGGVRGLTAALEAVRPAGTVVSVSAHTAPTWEMPLARSFAAELSLRFVIGDSIRARRRLSALVAAGVLDPRIVISGRRPLADAARAYADLGKMDGYKVVLDPWELIR